MTVLIGLYCSNGVVIGSDSAATSAAGQMPLIKQATTKVEAINDKILVATTGAVGLSQRFKHHIRDEWSGGGFRSSVHQMSTSLTGRAMRDFQSSLSLAMSGGNLGFGALMAAPVGDEHQLIEFSVSDLQPEIKGHQIPFVSMGSGQVLAEPFLGFIRRVFWSDEPPSLHDGVFATLWCLRHTFDLVPGGVGPPAQIAVLERGKRGQWQVRLLDDDDLQEHQQHCDAAERHIGKYRSVILGEAEDAQPPEVPTPTASA
ncbi:MAG: hypothetical protein MJA83_16875 [Gammaproteobacteria bacterium]|nr:hypothetical protein [Gammaproteobacteria bacterium]